MGHVPFDFHAEIAQLILIRFCVFSRILELALQGVLSMLSCPVHVHGLRQLELQTCLPLL